MKGLLIIFRDYPMSDEPVRLRVAALTIAAHVPTILRPFRAPGACLTMTGRFVDHRIRILAAAALLLAVMSSPLRPTGTWHAAHAPNYLQRNFAILETGDSGKFAVSARPSLREAVSRESDTEDELDADVEDELTATSPPASVSFDALPSACPEPYSQVVSFAFARATRPLRC